MVAKVNTQYNEGNMKKKKHLSGSNQLHMLVAGQHQTEVIF